MMFASFDRAPTSLHSWKKRNMASKFAVDEVSKEIDKLRRDVELKLKTVDRSNVNVLLVGLPGVGKSSCVTTLRHCLFGSVTEEVSPAGVIASGQSYTLHVRKYPAITDNMRADLSPFSPVIFDMPGLPNSADDRIDAILRCVLEGRIPIGDDIAVIKQEDNLNRYEVNEANKIDRVIFVHSCLEEIPQNLVDALFTVCDRMGIIVISLLTHIDLPSHVCTKVELEGALRTEGAPRSFEAELYHTISDGVYKRIPETDRLMLLLWKSLLNQNYTFHSNDRRCR